MGTSFQIITHTASHGFGLEDEVRLPSEIAALLLTDEELRDPASFVQESLFALPGQRESLLDLVDAIGQLLEEGELSKADGIIERVRALSHPPLRERPEQKQWDIILAHKPSDLGGSSIASAIEERLSRYSGRGLEAMCGYNSFIPPRKGVEIVATDISAVGLSHYPYPERTRIQFDMNKIEKFGDPLPFTGEGFDFVSICYGYKYLSDPPKTFTSIRNSLRSQGSLILVEARGAAERKLKKRELDSRTIEAELLEAGFRKVAISPVATTGRFPVTYSHVAIEAFS